MFWGGISRKVVSVGQIWKTGNYYFIVSTVQTVPYRGGIAYQWTATIRDLGGF